MPTLEDLPYTSPVQTLRSIAFPGSFSPASIAVHAATAIPIELDRTYPIDEDTSSLMAESPAKMRGRSLFVSVYNVWEVSPRSGMDSDLEAFSHYPADGSVAALPGRTAAKTNYLNQRFLSY
ncbi:hypothetical protein CHU98_g12175 [Xylaria longipes]|nr:hypothetical protein CHU98_g12175 [Xylaria longipes]